MISDGNEARTKHILIQNIVNIWKKNIKFKKELNKNNWDL